MILIDAYTFCWNEEIMLKYYLNLYAPMCRKITLYDNGSTDKSKEITQQYDNVVWNTEVYGQNEIDDKILTNVKNNCWKQSKDADWVIVGDIDEILYHVSGLYNYLKYIKEETNYRILRSTGYDMVSETIPKHDGNIYDENKFRYGVKNEFFDKILIFSPASIDDINYPPGAHIAKPTISCSGWERRILQMSTHVTELKLLHYKYLSEKHFLNRTDQFRQRLCGRNIEKDGDLSICEVRMN